MITEMDRIKMIISEGAKKDWYYLNLLILK